MPGLYDSGTWILYRRVLVSLLTLVLEMLRYFDCPSLMLSGRAVLLHPGLDRVGVGVGVRVEFAHWGDAVVWVARARRVNVVEVVRSFMTEDVGGGGKEGEMRDEVGNGIYRMNAEPE